MQTKKENKRIVVDRWSVTMVIVVLSIVAFLFLLVKGNRKIAFLPFLAPAIFGTIVAMSPSRIRRNDYEGEIYYKGEKDCGFTVGADYKAIDGVMIPGTINPPIYKTADGTDIVIDKDGAVRPAGFGSRIVNCLDGGGYLNQAPDDCWQIKE